MSNSWLFREARARALRRQAVGRVETPPLSVRPANSHERTVLLEGRYGFVAERGDVIVGHIGYEICTDCVFCFNYATTGEAGNAAAMLYAAVRRVARQENVHALEYTIEDPYYDLMRLFEHGHAQCVSTRWRIML